MTKPHLEGRVLAGIGWMIGWRFGTRAIGFVSTLVLARVLTPTDFGVVAMASSLAVAIEALSQFALTDALVRRQDDAKHLYDTTFTMQLCRALGTGSIIAALAPAASAWFGEPRLLPIVLVLAGVSVISGFTNIGVVEFRREIDYSQQLRLMAIPRILQA